MEVSNRSIWKQRRVLLESAPAVRFLVEPLESRRMLADILGSASTFAVLAGSTVTSSGATAIVGDAGVSPGTSVTGFPPAVITGGAIQAADAAATQAEADVATAYGEIAAETPDTDLTGHDLGGLTLTPGVYHFDSSAALTGTLTLDAQGNPDARFDFQIGTTLITAANSAVDIINDGQANNVYFQLGTSATLAAGTAFEGNILADQSITLASGASLLDGRALALNAAVTMTANEVIVPPPASTVTTPVQTQADISVTNTTADNTMVAGDTITYTVTVTNTGPSDAQTVDLSDLVPANTTFVSDTQNSGPAFTLTSPAVGGTGTISGTIGTLAAGASASFTVVALVSPGASAGTTISSTADVSTATTDPNTANNSQTATTTVQTQANLSVTNTTTALSGIAGDTITYTVTLGNAGPSDALDVVMSNLVPANTTFVSDTQTSGPAFAMANPNLGGTGTITDTIDSLASGTSASFTIVERVLPSTPDAATITNTANGSAATSDPNSANNHQTVTTAVQALADLSVTNTTAAVYVLAGDTITYTVTVANAGPSDARHVVMADLIPANTTFVSDTQTSGPAFALADPALGGIGTISDTIDTLASGASASFTIVERVSPSTPDGGTITNTANVSNSVTDPDIENNLRVSSFNVGSTRPILTIASVVSPMMTPSLRPTLSVLGADTGSLGEAGLTYTWSVAHAPSGAKPVSFSVNGTNAAKNATIRVQKDGTYLLHCVVSNSFGDSVTASVELVIKQIATKLRLTPHAQTIAAGASLQYGATAIDQFGHPMRTRPDTTYAVNFGDGTFNEAGMFTAGQFESHVVIQMNDDDLIATLGATIS